ncbi:hypothetical protein [Agrococcus baldri]|uniref:Uncharacterized protein n=1 Tax=Agrococcus baldri TaxID=153730 RepID=A0AA87RF33_9MICO|nr:hypothetical protein [Agrococcus baldri]GEK81517.1 hypothetical protein ABA31_28680 [Agrococcus baldri]
MTTISPVERLESTAVWIRGFAVGWAVLALCTYLSGATVGVTDIPLHETRPIWVSASALGLFFLVLLAWPFRPDVRSRLPRILSVLRWQVATGVLIAFSLGATVRVELKMSVWLIGTYLAVHAIFFMLLALVDLALRRLYHENDARREYERHVKLMQEIATLTALIRERGDAEQVKQGQSHNSRKKRPIHTVCRTVLHLRVRRQGQGLAG